MFFQITRSTRDFARSSRHSQTSESGQAQAGKGRDEEIRGTARQKRKSAGLPRAPFSRVPLLWPIRRRQPALNRRVKTFFRIPFPIRDRSIHEENTTRDRSSLIYACIQTYVRFVRTRKINLVDFFARRWIKLLTEINYLDVKRSLFVHLSLKKKKRTKGIRIFSLRVRWNYFWIFRKYFLNSRYNFVEQHSIYIDSKIDQIFFFQDESNLDFRVGRRRKHSSIFLSNSGQKERMKEARAGRQSSTHQLLPSRSRKKVWNFIESWVKSARFLHPVHQGQPRINRCVRVSRCAT